MIKSKHNVIMIHGYTGAHDNHWFPYTQKKLEQMGVDSFSPQMPEEHVVEKWMETYDEFKDKINENTILIGHSLGCAIILHILATLEKPVFGTIFVAPFAKTEVSDDPNRQERLKELNTFVQDLPWKKSRKNAGVIKIYASTNDHISLSDSIYIANMMKTSIEFTDNAGHFCKEDGYEEFPKLTDYLKTKVYLTYDEFKKLDARIGEIKKVEPVEEADKLLRFEIDFGEESDRQIVSGIHEFFPDYKSLVGKKVLYVLNLEPREIKGVTSYGMLMAVDDLDSKPTFLIPEDDVNPGSKVR